MSSGYSGTPLIKKLGIKDGFSIKIINEPPHYEELVGELPPAVERVDNQAEQVDFVHLFTKSLDEYERLLPSIKSSLKPAGIIWISWPKKASKVATDLTEDIIRQIALSHGLVDVKVCAVDDTWSGLKLVIPVKDRNA